jgi:hypothetical protein
MSNKFHYEEEEDYSSIHKIRIKPTKPRNPTVEEMYSGGKYPPKRHATKKEKERSRNAKHYWDEK